MILRFFQKSVGKSVGWDKILLKNGYKKVKDLLIDEKIGVSKRDNILLALDNEGNVLSVLGIKKSEILKQMKDNNIIIKVEESYEWFYRRSIT